MEGKLVANEKFVNIFPLKKKQMEMLLFVMGKRMKKKNSI